MLESRVIKRCYPRFSVPSHLYARNAYDFFAFLRLFLPPFSSSVSASSLKLTTDGPGDCPSRDGKNRKNVDGGSRWLLKEGTNRERNELDTMINYAIRGSRKINDRYYCSGCSRAHTC